jgi:hypothetical protein
MIVIYDHHIGWIIQHCKPICSFTELSLSFKLKREAVYRTLTIIQINIWEIVKWSQARTQSDSTMNLKWPEHDVTRALRYQLFIGSSYMIVIYDHQRTALRPDGVFTLLQIETKSSVSDGDIYAVKNHYIKYMSNCFLVCFLYNKSSPLPLTPPWRGKKGGQNLERGDPKHEPKVIFNMNLKWSEHVATRALR